MNPPPISRTADIRTDFLNTESPRSLFIFNLLLVFVYFFIIAFVFPHGNPMLFLLLIIGEAFHLWQVVTFIYTVWDTSYLSPNTNIATPPVDVFITTAGEPIDIVEMTVRAVVGMRYGGKITTYILNDGFVAKKDNWRDAELLAKRMHTEDRPVHCITREVPGGAKAGNVNNALYHTNSPLIAIFDADHVPHVDFLEKTVAYFTDTRVGFVQTPQFYKNHNRNYLTQSSWEQQEIFYGAICRGKNRLNAATMCGTNMVISRAALLDVGGMCTESIAEDFVTGLFMHQRGYRSVYVPEVLAEGLATEDLLTYSKQQFRWARGALDVLFRYNPFFMRGLTFAQRVQYISSSSFYLSGIIVLIDMLLPIVFLYTGLVPIKVEGMLLATIFLPYMLVTLYMLQRVTNFTFTYQVVGLSMASFHIQLQAVIAAITRQKSSFSISSKAQLAGNFTNLAMPQFIYIAATVVGVIVALFREGVSASLMNNLAWAIFNISIFVPFIRASLPERTASVRRITRSIPAMNLMNENAYGNVTN